MPCFSWGHHVVGPAALGLHVKSENSLQYSVHNFNNIRSLFC